MTKIMNLDEVAVLLRVHRSTIYRMLKQHQIPAFRVGSDWRFDADTIERWQAERTIFRLESRMGYAAS